MSSMELDQQNISTPVIDIVADTGYDVRNVKNEVDILVKPELQDCIVCSVRSGDSFDIQTTNTSASGTLLTYISKFTPLDIDVSTSKYLCKGCFNLVSVLEQAELEYKRLKQAFEEIISKNPIFEANKSKKSVEVKTEFEEVYNDSFHEDSEDEPLSVAKKKNHRKEMKRKKKTNQVKRRDKSIKSNKEIKNSWSCEDCGHTGTGGSIEETAHKLLVHSFHSTDLLVKKVKDEDTETIPIENGFDTNKSVLKVEVESPDDDDDYLPDEDLLLLKKPAKKLSKRGPKSKVVHKCDECDAKYYSIIRLKNHKQMKHSDSKPPYICEICGAHYKHKRACDVHVALHKGISDWKCEECNKLFPSKGALRRHNNIHTGKVNYQCDLCGKSFIHTSSFKMHKLSHSGVKPHACDVCGLALLTSSHLTRHKRVHSGEKRHECGVCGKKFSERYNPPRATP